jgi:hypothetical protein
MLTHNPKALYKTLCITLLVVLILILPSPALADMRSRYDCKANASDHCSFPCATTCVREEVNPAQLPNAIPQKVCVQTACASPVFSNDAVLSCSSDLVSHFASGVGNEALYQCFGFSNQGINAGPRGTGTCIFEALSLPFTYKNIIAQSCVNLNDQIPLWQTCGVTEQQCGDNAVCCSSKNDVDAGDARKQTCVPDRSSCFVPSQPPPHGPQNPAPGKPSTVGFSYDSSWNGYWKSGCHYPETPDLQVVTLNAQDKNCGAVCHRTNGCSHYVRTADGPFGTCYLKAGSIPQIPTPGDSNYYVCGFAN